MSVAQFLTTVALCIISVLTYSSDANPEIPTDLAADMKGPELAASHRALSAKMNGLIFGRRSVPLDDHSDSNQHEFHPKLNGLVFGKRLADAKMNGLVFGKRRADAKMNGLVFGKRQSKMNGLVFGKRLADYSDSMLQDDSDLELSVDDKKAESSSQEKARQETGRNLEKSSEASYSSRGAVERFETCMIAAKVCGWGGK